MNHKKIGSLIAEINRLESDRTDIKKLLDSIHTGNGFDRSIGRVAILIEPVYDKEKKRIEIDLAKGEKDYRGVWDIDTTKIVAGTEMLLLGLRKHLQGQIDILDQNITKKKSELKDEVAS